MLDKQTDIAFNLILILAHFINIYYYYGTLLFIIIMENDILLQLGFFNTHLRNVCFIGGDFACVLRGPPIARQIKQISVIQY